eukprot:121639-Chlamydomonas_euryale.AAC.7
MLPWPVQVAALQQLCTLDTGLLPGAGDDVDPSLRELLSEVQRFGLQQGVSRSSAVPEPVLRARYAAVSTKLDSLPSALCRTAASLMLVPLPGRHVRGYKVDRNGRVVRTAEVGGFLGMSPDPATVEHMQVCMAACCKGAEGGGNETAFSMSPDAADVGHTQWRSLYCVVESRVSDQREWLRFGREATNITGAVGRLGLPGWTAVPLGQLP